MRQKNIKTTDVLIAGGGPAGLCAALAAASLGAKVVLIDENEVLGGQLVKQTHKFFGSEKQYAGTRGIHIKDILISEVEASSSIEVINDATVMGYYTEDGIVTYIKNDDFYKIKPGKVIFATGASERMLPFPKNDLPGIYGAGGVQTLMNVYGIAPGNNVLMIGAGNIGLIVSYQLIQAGVNVQAIVEAMPKIGGYLVHASKIRRAGVPIYTSHTIKEAYGQDAVEGAVIWEVDEKWQPIPGTEKDIKADNICLAVGLTPATELLWQAGCEMKYVPELSGHVPVRNMYLQTTLEDIYVAGDAAGVEEASSAMVEGRLAGYSAAKNLGLGKDRADALIQDALDELSSLREGEVGAKIRKGLEKIIV
ncbi:MAG: Sarcosine oxidase alpha subunit [Firmicutes bacterium]|nr:Sarcosine oxidase alpha subunit [Bacillota bacterium]